MKSLTRGKISSKTFNSLGGRHQRIYERTQERSIFNNLDTKRYWYCCRLHSSPYKSSMHQERCDDYLECVFSHKVEKIFRTKKCERCFVKKLKDIINCNVVENGVGVDWVIR